MTARAVASGGATDGDRPRILLVDDQPANLLALESVLEPLDYELVRAQSGQDALLKALQLDFVLILMDVHMPGLDGYETVEMLRTRPRCREIPVMFLTAVNTTQEETHRGYGLGASDYITKPFDPVVLRAKVSTLVTLYTRGRHEEQARREAMDRLRDLFLGALGHDLRNPLQTIVMASSVLRTGPLNEESLDRYTRTIERTASRMQRMVDDILDLTVGKFSGAIPLSIGPTDLASVCRNVVAEIQAAHPKCMIQLEVAGSVKGEWDGGRLGRVLANLVTNAVHHAPSAGIRVGLADEGQRVKITVHNEGKGILQEVLPRLFEPFRRGDTSAQGWGLGLYIVREIARAHGGDVEVHSSDTEGTTFGVTLPRRPSPSSSKSA